MIQEEQRDQDTETEKKRILAKLREKGCRITRQRIELIDTILANDCASCKEIYYIASANDSGLGIATVYRMVNLLEEIGVINRKNMYAVSGKVRHGDSGRRAMPESRGDSGCRATLESRGDSGHCVKLEDGTVCRLTREKWNDVIRAGLKAHGYLKEEDKSTHKEDRL